LATITCASSAGPGRPRSIGRLGAGAWKIASQRTHASFGRTWRKTLKCPGTYSSWSATSWPIWRSFPPHWLQPHGASGV